MICKSCGLDAGETGGLFNEPLKCGNCGREFDTPIMEGQKREFRQDITIREAGIYIKAGDKLVTGKIGREYSSVKCGCIALQELLNNDLLTKTRLS